MNQRIIERTATFVRTGTYAFAIVGATWLALNYRKQYTNELSQRYDMSYLADTNRDFIVDEEETRRAYGELNIPYKVGNTLKQLSESDVERYLKMHPRSK